jgi:phenylalanine-4-hydroxylase
MKPIPLTIKEFLKTPYQLTKGQVEYYDKNRFIKLKQVLNEETIAFYNTEISEQVAAMNTTQTSLLVERK